MARKTTSTTTTKTRNAIKTSTPSRTFLYKSSRQTRSSTRRESQQATSKPSTNVKTIHSYSKTSSPRITKKSKPGCERRRRSRTQKSYTKFGSGSSSGNSGSNSSNEDKSPGSSQRNSRDETSVSPIEVAANVSPISKTRKRPEALPIAPIDNVVPNTTAFRVSLSEASPIGDNQGRRYSNMAGVETAQIAPARRRSQNLSPGSLRVARLKKFDAQAAGLGSAFNVRQRHEEPLKPGLSQSRAQAGHLGSQKAGASNDISPQDPDQGSNRARQPNIEFRLVQLDPSQICVAADEGLVVDILPSNMAERLVQAAASPEVQDHFNAYLNRFQHGTPPVLLPLHSEHPVAYSIPEPCGTFNQFCYISKLAVSDIGSDGRRKSHSSAGIANTEDEKWTALLVPLTDNFASNVRRCLSNYLSEPGHSRYKALRRRMRAHRTDDAENGPH